MHYFLVKIMLSTKINTKIQFISRVQISRKKSPDSLISDCLKLIKLPAGSNTFHLLAFCLFTYSRFQIPELMSSEYPIFKVLSRTLSYILSGSLNIKIEPE